MAEISVVGEVPHTAEVAPGLWVVVRIVWMEKGASRESTFGPWPIREGWPHLEAIQLFLRAWCAQHGHPLDASLSLVSPPDSLMGPNTPAVLDGEEANR